VAHQLKRPVDRGRRQRSKFFLPMDPARLLQIGDEVFDADAGMVADIEPRGATPRAVWATFSANVLLPLETFG
jgi:hypothetical protein